MITLLLVLAVSYILGSIPTSVLAGRLIAGVDIREHGSANAGATNVYRVLGLGPAVVVGVVDVCKGAAAALLVSQMQIGVPAPVNMTLLRLMAGGAAIVGHIWPVFAGFRGGKGVATTIGVLAGTAPLAMLAALVVWLILLFASRIMSLASLAAAVVLPVAAWVWEGNPDGSTNTELVCFTSVLCVLIFFTHRDNIRRLMRGEELTLGRRRIREDTAPPPVEENSHHVVKKVAEEVSERIDQNRVGERAEKAGVRKETE